MAGDAAALIRRFLTFTARSDACMAAAAAVDQLQPALAELHAQLDSRIPRHTAVAHKLALDALASAAATRADDASPEPSVCPGCMDDLPNLPLVVRIVSCQHDLCAPCLQRWVDSKPGKPTCPECRQPLLLEQPALLPRLWPPTATLSPPAAEAPPPKVLQAVQDIQHIQQQQAGAKVVVASHHKSVLQAVQQAVDQVTPGACALLGQYHQQVNNMAIERFYTQPCCQVLLVLLGSTAAYKPSTLSCLDLSNAQALLLMEPPLLPHQLQEAIAACCSVGNSFGARVIQYVAKGTVEEQLAAMGRQYMQSTAAVYDSRTGGVLMNLLHDQVVTAA